VVLGVLAGVVLGNGVYFAGGMTAMAIEHAASSRMPAGIAQSLATAGALSIFAIARSRTVDARRRVGWVGQWLRS
jgi:hypothetical protein